MSTVLSDNCLNLSMKQPRFGFALSIQFNSDVNDNCAWAQRNVKSLPYAVKAFIFFNLIKTLGHVSMRSSFIFCWINAKSSWLVEKNDWLTVTKKLFQSTLSMKFEIWMRNRWLFTKILFGFMQKRNLNNEHSCR